MSDRVGVATPASVWLLLAVLLSLALAGRADASSRAGTPDPAFASRGFLVEDLGSNPGFSSQAVASAVAPDGTILIAANVSGAHRSQPVERLGRDGRLDGAFGRDGVVEVTLSEIFGMAVQPDGKIVLVGSMNAAGTMIGVLRLDPSGALDRSFGSDGVVMLDPQRLRNPLPPGPGASPLHPLAVLRNGRVVVGLSTAASSIVRRPAVVLLRSDGRPDRSFAPSGVRLGRRGSLLQAIAAQRDGDILIATAPDTSPLRASALLERLDGHGQFTRDFGHDGTVRLPQGTVAGLLPQPKSITIFGRSVGPGATAREVAGVVISQIGSDGRPRDSFGTRGRELIDPVPSHVTDITDGAIDSAGRIVLGGTAQPFDAVGGLLSLIRLTPRGRLDGSFATNGVLTLQLGEPTGITPAGPRAAESEINSLSLQHNDDVVIAGDVTGPSGEDDWLVGRILG